MAEPRWKELHQAAVDDNEALMFHLLKKGIDINARDKDGRTALHKAVVHDHGKILQALIFSGANLNVSDKKGQTPLHEASVLNHTNMARILVQHGADIEVENKNGKTALDIAFENGHANVIDILETVNDDMENIDGFFSKNQMPANNSNQQIPVDNQKETEHLLAKISENNLVCHELKIKLLLLFEEKERNLQEMDVKIKALITELSQLIERLDSCKFMSITDGDNGRDKTETEMKEETRDLDQLKIQDNITILIDRVILSCTALRQQLEVNDEELALIKQLREKDLEMQQLRNVIDGVESTNENQANDNENLKLQTYGQHSQAETPDELIERDDKLRRVTAVKDDAVNGLRQIISDISQLNHDNNVNIEKLQECFHQLSNEKVIIYASINIANANNGDNAGYCEFKF